MQQPNVLDYLDLNQYLKDVYKYKKESELYFSYEKWTEQIGLKSRAYLRALVVGDKPFNETVMAYFVKSFKFSNLETEHFINLCNAKFNPDDILKKFYHEKSFQTWKNYIEYIHIENIHEFLSEPATPTVFTYLSFDDSSSDAESISQNTGYSVDVVQKSLRCLIWQKLIDGNIDSNGQIKYKTISPYFNIQSTAGSSTLKNYHLKNLKKAFDAVNLPSDQRKYYSTFVALDPSQFMELQKTILEFNQKILKMFNSKSFEGKKIYHVNLQAIPTLAPSSN